MAASTWQRASTLVFIAVFLVTSCTTVRSVSVPTTENPSALSAIKVGDEVVITTKDGKKQQFKVQAIEPDALVGKDHRVAYADMATLGVERIHKGATATLVVIAVFLVTVAVSTAQLFDDWE